MPRKPKCKTKEEYTYHDKHVWVKVCGCKEPCVDRGYLLPYGSFTDLQGTLE